MPLLNILKKQKRAQAQFFFAFQVSFKSRNNHDPTVLEVEASKCFTSCKHSNQLLQITYNLRRGWLTKNLNLPQMVNLLCMLDVRKKILKLLLIIDTLLQSLIGVKSIQV